MGRAQTTVLAKAEVLRARIPQTAVRRVVTVALLAAIVVLAFRSRSLLAPLGRVGAPDAGWLALAVLAQAGSLVAYALVVRDLLGLGGVAARIRSLLRATLGGIAMSASLPGGQAASLVYWYKQLRREGAEGGLSALAMLGSMLAGIVSLAAVLVAGVALAGSEGPLAAARLPILAAVGSALVALLVFRRHVLALVRPLVLRVAPDLPAVARPSRRGAVSIGTAAHANWLLDGASLYLTLRAVGAPLPVEAVLVTYALAMVAAGVPLLPGGGGTVEATLILGFAAFGHSSAALIAGVLLYRVISCWGLVPLGWVAVALEGRRLPLPRAVRSRRHAALVTA
jgi:uncharacterized membrane protein YbhN (UPF0104 family)